MDAIDVLIFVRPIEIQSFYNFAKKKRKITPKHQQKRRGVRLNTNPHR